MAGNEKKKELDKEISHLTEENQLYVLGMVEGFAFAQKTMDKNANKTVKNQRDKADR
jgi:hypothetical protein